jgi:hypothetical protein
MIHGLLFQHISFTLMLIGKEISGNLIQMAMSSIEMALMETINQLVENMLDSESQNRAKSMLLPYIMRFGPINHPSKPDENF